MKRLIYAALVLFMVSVLPSCDTYNYYTAGLNRTNMSGYRTFAWMPMQKNPQDKRHNNEEADAKIKDAATAALQGKGLTLQTHQPDLIVVYTATVGRGTRTNYYSAYPGFYGGWGWGAGFGYGSRWGWGGWYRPGFYAFGDPFMYYGGLTYAEQENYKEGTLIIDLIDRRTKKVVWRGFGVGEVHHNPQKNMDDLPKVVTGIIDQLKTTPPAGAYRTMSS
jgi:hypothetical protein